MPDPCRSTEATGEGCAPQPSAACVPGLSSLGERLAALRDLVNHEPEPLVTLTHLLRLCRDEHPVLWESLRRPGGRFAEELTDSVRAVLPQPGTTSSLSSTVRTTMRESLETASGVDAVVVAQRLAELIDGHYAPSFHASFARRSPYQPGVGDPLPLDGVDLPRITRLAPTSPPWRLANRLDETRHVRLAGEWAAQFRVVFDYSAAEALRGILAADTVIATCHPNRTFDELDLSRDDGRPSFPVKPRDTEAQRAALDRLLHGAVAAGASIVVLPELCVTEALAMELAEWVRRPNGLRLLLAGSYHREDEPTRNSPDGVRRRRNTAVAWVRGHQQPLTQDKHSPADHPIHEDINPPGWPEIRVHVAADGCHLVLAICRDLLSPHAVHALTEVGSTLVLVPAMSETLVPFGGPVAQLVADNQAVVAVADNPALWPSAPDVDRRPARALFGHPGFGQLARSVSTGDSEPGVALLHLHSGELNWLSGPSLQADQSVHRSGEREHVTHPPPAWVARLSASTRRWSRDGVMPPAVTLRTAAVLVLLLDRPAGPTVLLTQRTPDLAEYPGQLVFPGGATESGDSGPADTALREAREECGLAPDSVHILGLLPPYGLLDSGFLVTPVLAWSSSPEFPSASNLAEVAAIAEIPLAAGAITDDACPGESPTRPVAQEGTYGRMTATVLDALSGILS